MYDCHGRKLAPDENSIAAGRPWRRGKKTETFYLVRGEKERGIRGVTTGARILRGNEGTEIRAGSYLSSPKREEGGIKWCGG